MIGAGSSQLIQALLLFLSNSLILEVTPTFHVTAYLAERLGLSYRALPILNHELPLGSAVSAEAKRAIFLASPRNPFGYSHPLSEISELLERGASWVVVDEAYADFASVNALSLTSRFPNLTIVRTLSKAWGLANLRVGYAVCSNWPQDFHKNYLLDYNVGELPLRVASALLSQPGPVLESINGFRSMRETFSVALSRGLECKVWPTDANFIFVETASADLMVKELSLRDVLVTNVSDIPYYPAGGPKGFRISVPPPAETSRVLTLLASAQHLLNHQ